MTPSLPFLLEAADLDLNRTLLTSASIYDVSVNPVDMFGTVNSGTTHTTQVLPDAPTIRGNDRICDKHHCCRRLYHHHHHHHHRCFRYHYDYSPDVIPCDWLGSKHQLTVTVILESVVFIMKENHSRPLGGEYYSRTLQPFAPDTFLIQSELQKPFSSSQRDRYFFHPIRETDTFLIQSERQIPPFSSNQRDRYLSHQFRETDTFLIQSDRYVFHPIKETEPVVHDCKPVLFQPMEQSRPL